MKVTDEMIAQIDQTPAEWQGRLLRQWETRGYDVNGGPLGVMLVAKPDRPKGKAKRKGCAHRQAASSVGDRVKQRTAWTRIRECQRCTALRKKLNGLTVAQVREGIDGYAAELVANLVALAKGEAVDLEWWDRKTAEWKAKGALAVMEAMEAAGGDSVFERSKALILAACADEEAELSPPAADRSAAYESPPAVADPAAPQKSGNAPAP